MNRVPTGIAGLDAMLDGGLLPSSATLVQGAPGAGKTTLALQFLAYGATVAREPGLLISFEEFPQSLYRDAASVGFDLPALEKSGALAILFTSPEVFLGSLEDPQSPLAATLREKDVRRVALDSATHLTRLTTDSPALRKHYHALVASLKRERTTSLLLGEDVQAGIQSAEQGGLAFVVDCVVLLRYLEIDSQVQRALMVLKMRGSSHAKDIRRYEIERGGIVVGKPFAGHEGLLSGVARRSLISTVR